LYLEPLTTEGTNDLLCDISTPPVRIVDLVIVCREAVEVVYDVLVPKDIHFDSLRRSWACLPMRSYDHGCPRLDSGCYFLIDGAEFLVCGVTLILEEIGAADAKKVDWGPGALVRGDVGGT
jgi:hypothetical protein